MKRIVAGFLLLVAVLGATAQHQIRGRVLNHENGEPLPGAHIILEETYQAVVSQQDGQFIFTRVKAGNYTLKVTYLGFKTEFRTIDLQSEQRLEFRLQPTAIMEDEVIIRATRAAIKSPTTYSLVQKREIEKINLGRDMPYLLQYTPGVTTTSDAGNGVGYTGIRIRGTDLFRINVTLNGIALNDAESQGVWWVDLPDLASSVDNIQIQRGVGTSTNGPAAFGASINIQSQGLNQDPYAELNTAYGSFNTSKMTLKAGTGLIKGKWALDARYSRLYSDGYIDRAFSDLRSFYVSGGYYGQKTLVKISMISGDEQTYQAWDGVPGNILDTNRTFNGLGSYVDLDGNPRYYDNQTDNYRQDHYQVFLAQTLGRRWTFNSALHYTRGKGYYEEYRVDQDFAGYNLPDAIVGGDTIASTDLIRQRWLDNDFYGITLAFNYDDKNRINMNLGGSWSYYEGGHFGEVIWSRIATQYDFPHRWYNNVGRKTDANLYGKVHYQLTTKLNGYLDLQFRRIDYRINGFDNDLRDITQDHAYNFFNPKVGVYYEFNTQNKAYLSFAVGNREPNRSALVDANPERPAPVHETLYDLEAGYAFTSGRYAIEVTGYYMSYDNQLVLTGKINDVGDPVMENVKDSYRAGIELSFGMKIASRFNWETNLALSRNKIRNFTEYTDDWDNWPQQVETYIGITDISFSPNIVFNNVLDYAPVKDLHLMLFSKAVGKQFISNASAEFLDPYIVHDLLISYAFHPKFMKEISVSFKIMNLLNEQYETNAWIYKAFYQGDAVRYDGYFPQAGIHFMGGLNLRF